MKTTIVNRRGKLIYVLPLAALLMAVPALWNWDPPTALAQVTFEFPWTSIGAGGTVDERSLAEFGFSPPGMPAGPGGASAGYRAGSMSTAPLEFRYNVTNTRDSPIPVWTTLEVGATAPGTSSVVAQLWRVNKCTGQQQPLCQRPAEVMATGSTGICRTCTFPDTAVNFTDNLYYVRVEVDRTVTADRPQVHTLRIY